MAKENQQKENYRQHERETTAEKKIRPGQTVNTIRSMGKTIPINAVEDMVQSQTKKLSIE